MLKRLAIDIVLVVLIAASVGMLKSQSAPLSPPKEGITKGDSSQNEKKQSQPAQDQNKPIELTAADVEMEPAPCDEACQQGRRNLEIQGKLEWFTGVLAFVGFLQVGTMIWQAILLWKTRGDIHAQADLMKEQVRDARESGRQTFSVLKEQADTALIQTNAAKERERARLGIRSLDVPKVLGPESILDGMRPLRVCAFVENFGRSKAFNARAYGILDIVSDPNSRPRERGFLQYFPQIIDEGSVKHPLKLGGFGREFEDVASSGDALLVSEEMIQEIRNGNTFIQASGKLAYEDIFGDSHTVPFRFVWKSVGDDDGGKWLTRSFWLDCRPPSNEQDDPDPDYDIANPN